MLSISWSEIEAKAPSLKQRLDRHPNPMKQNQILENWKFEQNLIELVQSKCPIEVLSQLSLTLIQRLEENREEIAEIPA